MTIYEEISQLIQAKKDELAVEVINQHEVMQPELFEKYGVAGRAKCLQDVKYHLDYLSEAIAVASPTLFAEYLGWARTLLSSLNIPTNVLAENIEIIRNVVNKSLSPQQVLVVNETIDMGMRLFTGVGTIETDAFLNEQEPLGELVQKYTAALLRGERNTAHQLIMDAVDDNMPIKEIYLDVFQRSQRELGRLWQTNKITVAQEHYCTAATQLIMSQLYPYIFTREKKGARMVATCIGGELHEMGIRMVADFFEMDGWDTFYLGANTPTPSIVQEIISREAQMLAISTTMTFHISKTTDLINTIRDNKEINQIKILVGGYPFNLDDGLWQRVGADGFAGDAQTAVDTAERLI